MEILITLLAKLTIVFFGCGIGSLFAVWIFQQTVTIPALIFESERASSNKTGVKIKKRKRLIHSSNYYEIAIPGGQNLTLFSSEKGIKVLAK